MKGILAVWKPKGPTSNDVLKQIKRATGETKVGHAGTLDPLASGILVIGIGREATKRLACFVEKEKEYLAQVRLGVESETDDAEGKKTPVRVEKIPSRGELIKVLREFEGKISQIPPLYSAVKIRGQEAYKRARRGEEVKPKSRLVVIKKIELVDYSWPLLVIKTTTGPGVYVRALARDLGKRLETGGYLAELERTRVGSFDKKNVLSIKAICSKT